MIKTYTEQVQTHTVNNINSALTDAVYPASGSFIEVGDFERFVFEVHLGTVDAALTFQVQHDTGATQTGNIKNVTGAVKVFTADDDNDLVQIEVETRHLDRNNGFNYVTLLVSGVSGTNTAALKFLGINKGNGPVTQPSDVETVFVGG